MRAIPFTQLMQEVKATDLLDFCIEVGDLYTANVSKASLSRIFNVKDDDTAMMLESMLDSCGEQVDMLRISDFISTGSKLLFNEVFVEEVLSKYSDEW